MLLGGHLWVQNINVSMMNESKKKWYIDRMHKWWPKKNYFVYVLIRLTSLALKQHFFCILSMQTRLVRLISTQKKIFFLATIYEFGL